jgi:hypothetical protein
MTRDVAARPLAAHPQGSQEIKKHPPVADSDRALRATTQHVMR